MREGEVIIEAFLVAVGVTVTSAVGIPIAVRLARAELPGFGRAPSAAPRQREVHIGSNFVPLDLGPDPMKWPSSTPWPSSGRTFPEPDWPSASWNDEHFGRHARAAGEKPMADAGFHAMKPSDDPGVEARLGEQRREAARQELARRQQAEEAERAQRASERQPTPQRPQRREARKPAPQPPVAPPASPIGGPPGREEIESLVASVGLAGTVQEVMSRTGWDFRKAAQYLAKVRSGA